MDDVDWSIGERCTVRGVLFICWCEDVLQLGHGSLSLTAEGTAQGTIPSKGVRAPGWDRVGGEW